MKTALIIEDNENNMVLITALLEKNGYRTVKAWTGQEGLALALKERPDFIILDIRLPDINGIEVLRQLRNSEINGKIPIIAMTSYAMLGDQEKMLAAGCTGYIEKPIDPGKVIARIKQIIGE